MRIFTIMCLIAVVGCLPRKSTKKKVVIEKLYPICSATELPKKPNTLIVRGNINRLPLNMKCRGRQVKTSYKYDHVGYRGSYQISCKKGGVYVSAHVRNFEQGNVAKPNFPYGGIKPTFTLTVKSPKGEVQLGSLRLKKPHNKKQMAQVTYLKRDLKKSKKGISTDQIQGCIETEFEDDGELVGGLVTVQFNVTSLADRRAFKGEQ